MFYSVLNGLKPSDYLVVMDNGEDPKHSDQHKRYRRNVEDEFYMQKLTSSIESDAYMKSFAAPHMWSDTPCSKRIFCEVMVQQNPDEVIFMEKKMDSLLAS